MSESFGQEEPPREPEPARAIDFSRVQTYGEQARHAYKAKRSRVSYHTPNSRKKACMARRAGVRDSKRAYRVLCIQVVPLSDYRSVAKGSYFSGAPTVCQPKAPAETSQDAAWLEQDLGTERVAVEAGEEVSSASGEMHPTTALEEGEVTNRAESRAEDVINLAESDEDEEQAVVVQAAEWPSNVERIRHTINPDKHPIPDSGSVDWCGCSYKCLLDRCANACASMFCAKNNCKVGRGCGNRLRDAEGLQLMYGPLGYTVFAATFIPKSTVVGEYAGVFSTHDYANDPIATSEYAVQLQTRTSRKQNLFIDTKERGSLMRFMNHSCDPNSSFFEVHNRRHLTIVVTTIEGILPGTELSVSYGDALWFKCRCGSINCREIE